MIDQEQFPRDFELTILYQLWKQKGSREDLNNHRYINIKEWLLRLTESLTVTLMKDDILRSGNKYQIGGVPGHRVEEHLIVVKSIMERYIKLKKWCDTPTCRYTKVFRYRSLKNNYDKPQGSQCEQEGLSLLV